MNSQDMSICHSSRRFSKFLDQETSGENNEKGDRGHVRTMDISIIQHKGLRQAFTMGLNHIPLRSTIIFEAIQVIHDTFLQVCQVLNVEHMLDMDVATKEVRQRSKMILLDAYKISKFGFRYSQPYLFTVKDVNDELNWLLKHVFISGLDKASNNTCFICINHIRKQTLERLSSRDFLPCVINERW